MDRVTVYPGQIPLETDVLRTNKFGMIAVAKLAAAMLGTSTVVNGLACVPTSPASLQVNVNPGEMYSLVNVDATAYSSLAADTTHSILKQGISLDAVTLSCPAPATGGQSINYLIQAAYQDTDTDNVALPYYNASNPSQAWSGPNNSGTPQSTTRKGAISISAKAGTAATTGSQTTPAADTGYTGLWVVTVANGQSTITSANITQATNAPILPADLLHAIQQSALTVASDTGSANTYVVSYSPPITTLVDGMVLWFKAKTANTGASTLNVNGLGAVPLVGGAHAALQSSEIIANGKCQVVYKADISSFVLIECTGGAVQVAPATQSQHAVQLAQLKGLGLNAVLNAINTNTTLTAASMGQSMPIFGAGGITVTLPAVSATSAGQRLEFFNYSSGTVTVACAGTDAYVPNGSTNPTSLSLGAGDTLVLESLGSSGVWYVVGGSVQLIYAARFVKSSGGNILAVRRFTSNGTYTPTAGTVAVRVQLVGGGGGGGGSSATGASQQSVGAGGAGGSYAESYITSAFSGVTMTIGAAGTAGAVGGNGGNGGTTSFGALLSAAGGGGGQTIAAQGTPFVLAGGATGALPTTGNIVNAQGTPGGVGLAPAPTSAANFLSGAGGASFFGGGASPLGSSNSAGNAGSSYGSGGSGGCTGASSAGQIGGAGAAGVIIVTEYGNIQ